VGKLAKVIDFLLFFSLTNNTNPWPYCPVTVMYVLRKKIIFWENLTCSDRYCKSSFPARHERALSFWVGLPWCRIKDDLEMTYEALFLFKLRGYVFIGAFIDPVILTKWPRKSPNAFQYNVEIRELNHSRKTVAVFYEVSLLCSRSQVTKVPSRSDSRQSKHLMQLCPPSKKVVLAETVKAVTLKSVYENSRKQSNKSLRSAFKWTFFIGKLMLSSENLSGNLNFFSQYLQGFRFLLRIR